MAKIRITTLYDIICDGCRTSWAESYNDGMGHYSDKGCLQRDAYREGWISRNGKTYCPECAAEYAKEQERKRSSQPRSHMKNPCAYADPKFRKNAKKTRETMPDGTNQLFCYGYTNPCYDGDVFTPECAHCPNNVIFAQEIIDKIRLATLPKAGDPIWHSARDSVTPVKCTVQSVVKPSDKFPGGAIRVTFPDDRVQVFGLDALGVSLFKSELETYG